ncbi:hypothetical protein A3715_18255 [Oleiphilus sp. HI0009]|nr:hypothetical protein A3715_18255 [Oleiphilus sp. HI0009]
MVKTTISFDDFDCFEMHAVSVDESGEMGIDSDGETLKWGLYGHDKYIGGVTGIKWFDRKEDLIDYHRKIDKDKNKKLYDYT